MAELGPAHIQKGKILGGRWKVLKKLGEGGCGAVYRVEDVHTKDMAALKAENNNVSGGSVLKLEVQILKRLKGKSYVAQLLHSGKKETYSYMVMILLGESLNYLQKKWKGTTSLSTQVRIGINVLHGLKQIHEIGFVHRDVKPANIAVGRKGSPDQRFLHILDFGLAREFVVIVKGSKKMRRPRSKAMFRGTARYCSLSMHDKKEQGRCDDLWSLVYMLAEMRNRLPWTDTRDKRQVGELKRKCELKRVLADSPSEMLEIAECLRTLNYYHRPDYLAIYQKLYKIMAEGKYKFGDAYDWEEPHQLQFQPEKPSAEVTAPSAEATGGSNESTGANNTQMSTGTCTGTGTGTGTGSNDSNTTSTQPDIYDPYQAFTATVFATDLLGF